MSFLLVIFRVLSLVGSTKQRSKVYVLFPIIWPNLCTVWPNVWQESPESLAGISRILGRNLPNLCCIFPNLCCFFPNLCCIFFRISAQSDRISSCIFPNHFSEFFRSMDNFIFQHYSDFVKNQLMPPTVVLVRHILPAFFKASRSVVIFLSFCFSDRTSESLSHSSRRIF